MLNCRCIVRKQHDPPQTPEEILMSTSTATALPTGLTAGAYTIDASHSEAGFTARHAMVTKVRGRFGAVAGTLVFGQDAASSSAVATIEVASVDTRDEGRDAHLRSADFFDVQTYPTLTFRSTGVRADGDGYLLDGELTIKDVTRPVTLSVEYNGAATDPFGNARVGFSGETEINRKDFGLTWNAALETGGVLVSDRIKVHVEVSAFKAS
jgi:polyisoprenoid-binding protein YceI